MPVLKLEDVFKTNGVPTHTFVEPTEYQRLKVALRTAGRGVVVEGPSGIGKTSAVEKALQELGLDQGVTKLTPRKKEDQEYLQNLPALGEVGTIVVDDFHKLDDKTKTALADYLKVLADEGRAGIKLIIVGINKAGDRLIQVAGDLVNRIDIIPFESNPENKVRELVEKGERALNVNLNVKDEIVAASQGSFYLAQMLSYEVCLAANILNQLSEPRTTTVSFEAIKANVWDRLAQAFLEPCKVFCRGPRMRPEGRAPYLNLLYWLASGREWSLSIVDAIRQHPELRGSITQIAEKGYLEAVIRNQPAIQSVLHFDAEAGILTVEDPQFVFFIRNIPWRTFGRDIGFLEVNFKTKYDFALSFCGADRDVAEALFQTLEERQIEVFYDRNEQNRMLAEDIEQYLRPIYQSEASFVVPLLGPNYPKSIWTKFESEAFKKRFENGEVIPIWFDTAPPGMFDETRKIGGLEFSRSRPLGEEIERIADLLTNKLREHRRTLVF